MNKKRLHIWLSLCYCLLCLCKTNITTYGYISLYEALHLALDLAQASQLARLHAYRVSQ